MNRAERRRMKKQGLPVTKEPVYQMKQSDIKKIQDDSHENAVDTAMILLFSLPLKVLYDKYGWGCKKRLPEFAEALLDEYQRFSDGDMSLEEYQEFIYETVGFKFQKAEGED